VSEDIVTRLRLRPTIMRKNRFGDMETDRAATALFDDCHEIMREAADEIERLRRNTGCARNQRSTQFCAEAVDAQRGFETLQDQLGKNAIALAATLRELRKVEVERDEARREVCDMEGETAGGALLEARKRGWDCFKEERNA
jgi:hypothetical protein